MSERKTPASSRSRSTGAVVHDDYRENFVIWPGREAAVREFVNQEYAGHRHKLRPTRSSNSEDALTWSCFDTLNSLPAKSRREALGRLWALAYGGTTPSDGFLSGAISIGMQYGPTSEQTEVDVSIEGDGVLVFVEAKLYSPMSLADEANRKPHDQIARKLRIGAREAQRTQRKFYFLILDIAPKEILRQLKPGASLSDAMKSNRGGFPSKWLTAYWFSRYKGGKSVTPLRLILKDIPEVDPVEVSRNMGWLVWSDVYKTVLRAAIDSSGTLFR